MSEKVLCPYCGTEMFYYERNVKGYRFMGYYFCRECRSRAPRIDNIGIDACDMKDTAKAAALQRYVEPNRVLTVEECVALDPDGATCVESSRGEIETQLNQEIINETSGMIEMYGLQNAKKLYGKYGRCWLRSPTDEERQSVAWEE